MHEDTPGLGTKLPREVLAMHFQDVCLHPELYLDTLKQATLHIVEHGVVLDHRDVFGLANELLVRINTRPEHLGGLRTHLAHLLCHLARSWPWSANESMLV